MSRIHRSSGRSQGPRTESPLIRLARLFEQQIPFDQFLLSLYAVAGGVLGRHNFAELSGARVYPNLYVVLPGPYLSANAAIEAAIGVFSDSSSRRLPRIVHDGVTSPLSLLYLVRGQHKRFEKETTEPRETAKFSLALVDKGATNRSILLTQPLSWGTNSEAGKRLRELLHRSFLGRPIAVPLSYRDGGRLESSDAHVGILAPATHEQLIALPTEPRSDFLCAFGSSRMIATDTFPSDELAYLDLTEECFQAITEAHLGEFRFSDHARALLETSIELLDDGILTSIAYQAVKIAMIDAVFHRQSVIERHNIRTALALIRESQRQFRRLKVDGSAESIRRVARVIVDALRTAGRPLSRTQLQNKLSRNSPRKDIDQAQSLLLGLGVIEVKLEPGGMGRPREVWTLLPGSYETSFFERV